MCWEHVSFELWLAKLSTVCKVFQTREVQEEKQWPAPIFIDENRLNGRSSEDDCSPCNCLCDLRVVARNDDWWSLTGKLVGDQRITEINHNTAWVTDLILSAVLMLTSSSDSSSACVVSCFVSSSTCGTSLSASVESCRISVRAGCCCTAWSTVHTKHNWKM